MLESNGCSVCQIEDIIFNDLANHVGMVLDLVDHYGTSILGYVEDLIIESSDHFALDHLLTMAKCLHIAIV
jgi:hypothetical protein